MQRLIIFTLSFLTIMMIASYAEAFELTMDEHLAIPAASTVAPVQEEPRNIPSSDTAPLNKTSSMPWWWFLAIPAMLLLIGLGWLFGLYMERRAQAKSMPIPSEPDVKENITPVVHRNNFEEVQIQTIQRTLPIKKQSPKRIPTHMTKPKHEPAIPFDMLDIHKAYRCFLFGRDEKMLNILEQAFRYDPYDLNPYLISIRILSESERPLPQLERLLRTGVFLLRSKNNKLWKEVSQHGNEFFPSWNDWFETADKDKAIHV